MFTLYKSESSNLENFNYLDIEKFNSLSIFEKYNMSLNENNALIGIDATCSVYQVIGALIRDPIMLTETNVIGDGRKKDFYVKLVQEFKKKISYDKIKELYENYLKTIDNSNDSPLT